MVAMNNGPERKREQVDNGENGGRQNETRERDYEEMQRVYRQRYLEQIRRQSCPGCGETDIADVGGDDDTDEQKNS